MNIAKALFVFSFALVLAVPARAQVAGPADKSKDAGKSAVKPGTAAKPQSAGGVVVFIDPATGQIRPPDASEIGALIGTAPKSPTSNPPLISGPGNAVGAVLDDSFLSYTVVSKTPDGKLKMDCVESGKSATVRIQGAQTPPKKAVLDEK